ncbi:hypothetical protein P7C70_g7321, partial [Phenoliferia sp. Uapishka_3]
MWAGPSSLDDDEGWQDMPVIRGVEADAAGGLDDDDRKRYHFNSSASWRLREFDAQEKTPEIGVGVAVGAGAGNAIGRTVDVDAVGQEWREKDKLDEMDYTRLELDDDPEEDEISMRTQYLFNEDKGMTPLSQMQATKTLLTEGQRIAYVGLCRLVVREMVQTLAIASKGAKELEPARESAQNWGNKIMGRLYRHMEVDGAEQRMIEQLAEHGVTSEDLVPSLATTHTVDNPEYDPDYTPDNPSSPHHTPPISTPSSPLPDSPAAQEVPTEVPKIETTIPPPELVVETDEERTRREFAEEEEVGRVKRQVEAFERRASSSSSSDPFGQGDDPFAGPRIPSPRLRSPRLSKLALDPFTDGADIGGALDPQTTPRKPVSNPFDDESGGDIGGAFDSPKPAILDQNTATPKKSTFSALHSEELASPASPTTPTTTTSPTSAPPAEPPESIPHSPQKPTSGENLLHALPSSLPGVSKTLTAADKTVTLDIRWTILCDLFLSLIADSVYDARSRVLLGKVAEKLGLEWLDVVRFERRLTEALEIQESVASKEHQEVLDGQRKKGMQKRYLMMGLATLGGGLVIGLSAGLLAPVIGAGLGAALTTVGVTGTTSFLAGAGGAAVISSGATLTGSVIGGRAMAKRTRHVKTFEFQPLHNNKRVNFYITVPGFMNGPLDDVRLPFSTLDPVVGDVFSVLWEPDMMGDTGNALKILTSEVLTQAGQQVLALTLMTALMSAVQWPLMLTKLSYLIDNPWSNALDRAKQAGAVLADILINRRLGVRPVSLVGFSLGARVIFFALIELAKANAFGVVQEVYLFGATLTASKKIWRQVRGVVSGRFVNAFAMNDWVLGYLFRATSGGLQTVAGLRPIEYVPDLENVDITHILVGHMSYRTLMPTLLAYVGFKVTADHFDEPEEMEMEADREVVTAEEEARRLEKKNRSKLGKFFRKKKDPNSSAPMSRNPSGDYDPAGSTSSLPLPDDASSFSAPGLGVHPHGNHDRSQSTLSVSSVLSDDSTDTKGDEDVKVKVEPASPTTSIHESAGFNLAKLREEVAQLPKEPSPPISPTHEEIPRSSSTPLPTISTNLTNLDTTLDPRDLLRRQWAGDSNSNSNEWGAPTTNPFAAPDAPPPPPLHTQPSFTFADASGAVDPSPLQYTFGNGEDTWGVQSNGFGSTPVPKDEPEQPPTFLWGKANGSTASFRSQNPW